MSIIEDDDAYEINLGDDDAYEINLGDDDDEDPEAIESWESDESEVEVQLPSLEPNVDQNNRSYLTRNRLSAIRQFDEHLRAGNQSTPSVLPGVIDIVASPVVALNAVETFRNVLIDSNSNDLPPVSSSQRSTQSSQLSLPMLRPIPPSSPPPQPMETGDIQMIVCVADKINKEDKAEEKASLDESTDLDPGTCLICYEPFTTSNDHRIVCLKCGHLYGKKCIETWMQTNGSKTRCPECNTLIKKNDVRIIYGRSVRALDTTERDEAVEKLDKIRCQNVLLTEQVDDLKMKLGLRESEIFTLKKELNEKDELIASLKSNRIQSSLLTMKSQAIERKREAFKLRERAPIQSGGARLICVFEILDYVIVSHRIRDNLYDGFGLRKFSIKNMRRVETLPLHKKMIRDMSMHPNEPLILTASMDRTIKLTNMINISVVRTFSIEVEPWSVCWDFGSSTRFFAGLNNGKVIVCCTQTGAILKEFATPIRCPVVSVQFLNTNREDNPGLLIVGLNTAYYGQFESSEAGQLDKLSFNNLNVEDRFLSSHVLETHNSGQILFSCRPSSRINHVHHWLIDYSFENVMSPLLIDTRLSKMFQGGPTSTMMTKSKIYPHPNDMNAALLCCSDEHEKGILVWESNQDEPLQKLKCGSVVLDLALMKRTSEIILMALTETELLFFSWSL